MFETALEHASLLDQSLVFKTSKQASAKVMNTLAVLAEATTELECSAHAPLAPRTPAPDSISHFSRGAVGMDEQRCDVKLDFRVGIMMGRLISAAGKCTQNPALFGRLVRAPQPPPATAPPHGRHH